MNTKPSMCVSTFQPRQDSRHHELAAEQVSRFGKPLTDLEGRLRWDEGEGSRRGCMSALYAL